MSVTTPCTIYTCAVSSFVSNPIATLDILEDLLLYNEITILIDIRPATTLANETAFSEHQIRDLCNSLHIDYHWAARHFANQFAATEEGPDLALAPPLRGFADHMRSESFASAYKQLINLCKDSRCLLMSDIPTLQYCSRRLIADYLLIQGHNVIHLLDRQQHQEHMLSAELRRESATLIYDRVV